MQKETNPAGRPPLLKRFGMLLRTNRRLEAYLYGGVGVVILLLYFSGLAGEKREQAPTAAADVTVRTSDGSETDAEERLRRVLSCIRGAGRVEVMITYETGAEVIPALSTNTNSNETETVDGEKRSTSQQITETSQPATLSGKDGNNTIVLLERKPVARGVIVVAEGAADVKVKLDLQRAVRAVLDIPLTNIEVFEMSADAAK